MPSYGARYSDPLRGTFCNLQQREAKSQAIGKRSSQRTDRCSIWQGYDNRWYDDNDKKNNTNNGNKNSNNGSNSNNNDNYNYNNVNNDLIPIHICRKALILCCDNKSFCFSPPPLLALREKQKGLLSQHKIRALRQICIGIRSLKMGQAQYSDCAMNTMTP